MKKKMGTSSPPPSLFHGTQFHRSPTISLAYYVRTTVLPYFLWFCGLCVDGKPFRRLLVVRKTGLVTGRDNNYASSSRVSAAEKRFLVVMCATAGGSRTKKRRCFVAAGLAARWAMRFDTSPRFGTVENTVLRGLFAGEICISRGKLSVICIAVFYYNPINASREVSRKFHMFVHIKFLTSNCEF